MLSLVLSKISYKATCQQLVCQQAGPFANNAVDFCSQLVHIWNFCHFALFMPFIFYFILISSLFLFFFFYFTTFLHINNATQIGIIPYILPRLTLRSLAHFALLQNKTFPTFWNFWKPNNSFSKPVSKCCWLHYYFIINRFFVWLFNIYILLRKNFFIVLCN